MKILSLTLSLLLVCLWARAQAVYPSPDVIIRHDLTVSNSITLNGVTKTSWPSGAGSTNLTDSGTNVAFFGGVTSSALYVTNKNTAGWTNWGGIFDGTTNYVGGDGAMHTMPSAAAGGTTNMMTVAMSCASATLSPTFAISGLQAAANGPRRVTFTVDYLTNSITTINAPGGTLTDGDTMIFRITQGGKGADYTVSGWNAVYKFGSDITGFTASTVASNPGNSTNATDYINFQYDATKTQWHPTGSVRGY